MAVIKKSLEPESIDYSFGEVKGFRCVNVIHRKGNGFLICFVSNNNTPNFIQFKNAIIGGFAYLASKNKLDKILEFYPTYEECLDVINKTTLKSLEKRIEKLKKKKEKSDLKEVFPMDGLIFFKH